MYTHRFQKRVRYAETDQMGYLYYGNYATYYEIGRVEMLRSLGLTYKAMEEEQGIIMPVMNLDIRFIRPGKYDELLTIETTLQDLPGRDIIFHMRIFNEQDELMNGGKVRLCFVDQQSNQRVNAPDYLVDALKPYF